MQQYHTREPIRVAAIFGPDGKILPVWFEWQCRKHTVIATTYRFESRRGESRLLHFTVKSEGGLYELTYNTDDQTWLLRGIEVE
jgi:hypothetical protein